jgi:hypothetical protein
VGGWVFGKKVSLRTTSQLRWDVVKNGKKIGLSRDLNPGPLAPKARIMPLDH